MVALDVGHGTNYFTVQMTYPFSAQCAFDVFILTLLGAGRWFRRLA